MSRIPSERFRTDLADTVSAVAATMLTRGYELDCVLGARLLTSALLDDGLDAEAVGTVLRVIDPTAARTGLQRGSVLQIGNDVERPGGFNGHVVVCAHVGESHYLLDPTIGQLLDHAITQQLGQKLAVLVTRLRERWPTPDRRDVDLPIDGWVLSYRHAPELDWLEVGGWNHPDLAVLQSEVRSFRDEAVDLGELLRRRVLSRGTTRVGRNAPCPCDSGKKFKHCCGR